MIPDVRTVPCLNIPAFGDCGLLAGFLGEELINDCHFTESLRRAVCHTVYSKNGLNPELVRQSWEGYLTRLGIVATKYPRVHVRQMSRDKEMSHPRAFCRCTGAGNGSV